MPTMKRAARAVLLAAPLAVTVTVAVSASRSAPAPPRAFRIARAADLVAGPASTGRIGDYRLSNGLVTAVIDRLGDGAGAAESGGNLVDLAPDGGEDYVCQLFTYFDETFPRQTIYEAIEVRADAEEAAVRVRGHDSFDRAIAVETEYVLRAGARHLLLRTRLTNHGDKPIAKFAVGDVIQWGHAERLLPGQGPRAKGKLEVPWVAGAGRQSSFLYGATDGHTLAGAHGSAWSDLVVARLDLPPGGSASYDRFVAVGTRGDYASALDAWWPLLGAGKRLGTLDGTVVEGGTGRPAAATVLALQGDRPVATMVAGADGRFRAQLPAGDYLLTSLARDRAAVRPVPVKLAPGTTSAPKLEVTAPGGLDVAMTSAGAPSAGKITLDGMDGTPDPDLGPVYAAAGAGSAAVTHDGVLHLVLPPGRYRATCSRGIEFDIDQHEITVAPVGPGGAPTRLACDLRRAVETPGRIAFDLHQHAVPSYDAAVSLPDRVIADLAEGLEGFVASDHNVITDYTAAIRSLGAGKRIFAITGDEATVEGLGHFNGYPLAVRPALARGGAPPMVRVDAAEVFRQLRTKLPGPADRVVQVNHPRNGREGYFDQIKFDPDKPGYPPGWAADFDAIEVVNGKRGGETEQALRDWFELLRRGKVATAVGNSDTHTIFGSEAGYPRNLIAVPHDDPARVTTRQIVDAIKLKRDVVLTNGPILTVSTGGAGPGGRARLPADPARTPVRVKVEAAPWVDVDRLDIYVDGKPAAPTLPVPASRDRVRFDRAVPVATHAGAFVVVIARGSKPLHPVVSTVDKRPVLPIAIANPIWIGGRR